jgi:serine/threonine protein kinase
VVSEEFRNYLKSLDGENADSRKLDELKKKGNEIKVKIMKMAVQNVTFVSTLHRSGYICRDHNPANTVCNFDKGTSKMGNIGFFCKIGKREDETLMPYCSSYEEYTRSYWKYILNDKSFEEGYMKDFIESLNFQSIGDAMTHPAADVYGIGMNLVQTLFVNYGMNFINETFKSKENVSPREDAADNLEKRDDLSKNLHDRLVTLNNALPKPMRYTPEQQLFIERLIGSCIDSNPLKRPTAAQVAYMLDSAVEGVEDFDDMLNRAMIDHPTPDDYFSPSTIEAYEILNVIPKQDNGIWKNGVVYHKLQQSSSSPSQQPPQSKKNSVVDEEENSVADEEEFSDEFDRF